MMQQITNLFTRKAGLIAITLAIAVCALGAIYSYLLEDTVRFSDENTYITLANSIATDHGFSMDGINPTAFRPPGYSALLSVFAAVGGRVFVFRCVNYVALAGSLLLAFMLAKRHWGPLAGVIAAVLVFTFPVFFFAAGTIFPQTITSLLLLVIVWLFFRDNAHASHAALLRGVLFGLLVLTTPTVIFTLLFLCTWELVRSGRRHVKNVALMLLAASLVIGAWSIRHYRTTGSLVFVSSNGGLNLLLGNSEHTTPNSGSTADIAAYYEHAADMDEVQRDRYFTTSALRFAAQNPLQWAKLYGLKFLNYFNYRNTLATRNEGARARDMIMLLTYGPLLLLAVARLFAMHRWPLTAYEKFAYLLYVLNGAFSALFFTRIRFRIPFDFFLITLAAMFVSRLLGEGRRSEPADHPSAG